MKDGQFRRRQDCGAVGCAAVRATTVRNLARQVRGVAADDPRCNRRGISGLRATTAAEPPPRSSMRVFRGAAKVGGGQGFPTSRRFVHPAGESRLLSLDPASRRYRRAGARCPCWRRRIRRSNRRPWRCNYDAARPLGLVPRKWPFHPAMGIHISMRMSEEAEGFNVAATRQNAGSALKERDAAPAVVIAEAEARGVRRHAPALRNRTQRARLGRTIDRAASPAGFAGAANAPAPTTCASVIAAFGSVRRPALRRQHAIAVHLGRRQFPEPARSSGPARRASRFLSPTGQLRPTRNASVIQ